MKESRIKNESDENKDINKEDDSIEKLEKDLLGNNDENKTEIKNDKEQKENENEEQYNDFNDNNEEKYKPLKESIKQEYNEKEEDRQKEKGVISLLFFIFLLNLRFIFGIT